MATIRLRQAAREVAPRSILSQVEDDLLGLDLAVAVDQVHPRAGSRCPLAERAGLPALDQVLAPGGGFVGLGPEVGDPGDQPAGELEERLDATIRLL